MKLLTKIGAPGAVQFSSSTLSRGSRSNAPQGAHEQAISNAAPNASIAGAGSAITRRGLMNMLTSISVASAVPTIAPRVSAAGPAAASAVQMPLIAPTADPLSTSRSDRANRVADAALITMADQYVIAEQKWCDLTRIVDRMDVVTANMPEVLRWRESDADLDLPDISRPKDAELVWAESTNVEKLRQDRWLVVSKTGDDNDLTIRLVRFTPSTAARARADEIIAAFDKWKKERKPRGYKKAHREADKAMRACTRIEDKILETRATTVQGMFAKVRCAHAYAKSDQIDTIEGGSCAETMARSIFLDIQSLAEQAQA